MSDSNGASKAKPQRSPREPANAPVNGQQTPATGRRAVRRGAPRRVRLTVSRVDTWSVLKIAFLLSVAVAIASVVSVVSHALAAALA